MQLWGAAGQGGFAGWNTPQCLQNLALHGELALAMPPSPKPPGATLARGQDRVGPVGHRLGPAAAARGIRTPRSVIPTRLGNLRQDLQRLRPRAGFRLRLAERAGGSKCCCCLRCLSGQSHPSPAAEPQRCSHRATPSGHGHSVIGDQGASGCQWGALESPWGVLV